MAVDLETLTRTDRGPLPWHAVQPEAVLARLDASPGGLSTGEAARRRERFGPNRIATAAGTPAWRVLVRQFANPLIYALIASAGLAFALGRTVDGLVVAAVVVLNALIGFVQEAKAGAAIEALGRLVGETAVAQRDGSPRTVPADAIVPGDLVLLGAGDKVPADLRVLAARGVRADESALTGESAPVAKGTEPVEAGVALGDRTSVLHGGSLVTAGSVTGVVTETGSRTELGRIAALVERTAVVQTPLVAALQALSRSLTAAIGAVALAIMAVGLVRGFPVADAALAAVTLAVAAIPEGLPAIVTIALAVGVRRMARRRAIVRRLPAVETLGSTTVVCTDKTGTLTRNRMEVQALWTPRGEEPHELLRAAVLCSDGALGPEGPVGDPTETAVLVAAERLGVDVEELRRRHPRRDAVPFESARRHMATLNELPEGGRIVYVKGAPEVVAELSGGAAAAAALEAAHEYARAGMRVLAVASRPAPDGLDHLQDGHLGHGFTLLGLVAMTDPPRPEAIEAVEACRRAGIEVKMITGDHVVTAEAIGRAMGFRDAAARTGAELERMAGEELDGVTAATSVFARVAPEHKLRLVDSLQRQGHVVAMTGDGVNDAPALKQADIGVAMGLGGTAVARESADVVLTDDNFASIRAAVEEGRRVYDNLVKALAFVLPTNLGEALIILVAVVAFPLEGGDPLLPVLPVQILWVNLVATVTLALPLAFEAMEPGVMDRPPRPPGTPILSRFVLGRTVLVAVLMTVAAIVTFLVAHDRALAGGAGEAVARAEAQTLAVTTIVLFQVAYLLTCRSLSRSVRSIGLMSNPAVFAGIGAILLLQLAFVELPLMQDAFHSAPLSPGAWLVAAAVGATVVPVIAMEKLRRRRRGA